jgi:dUTPase
MVRLYANEVNPYPQGPPVLEVTRLDSRAKLPSRPDTLSVGLDVFAFLLTESGRATSRAVHTQGVTEIPTGIKVHPPPGYFVQISSRLSLARQGILVANAPAMIAPRFDGELTVLLVNTSYQTQYIAHEHRIAQLTLRPIVDVAVRDISPPEHQEDVHSGPRQGYC